MVAHAHDHRPAGVEADRHGASLLALAIAVTATVGVLVSVIVTAAGLN